MKRVFWVNGFGVIAAVGLLALTVGLNSQEGRPNNGTTAGENSQRELRRTARVEYACLYQSVEEVKGFQMQPKFSTTFRVAIPEMPDTGNMKPEELAKKLNLKVEKVEDVTDIRLVNWFAAQGWELVTHSQSQSVFLFPRDQTRSDTASYRYAEAWHFRREK